MEFLQSIGFIIICYIGIKAFHAFQMYKLWNKFSSFRHYCELYKFKFTDFLYKKGLIYDKEISSLKMNNLLEKYGFTKIIFPKDTKLYEVLAIIDYDGTIKFYHHYSLYIKKEEKYVSIKEYNPYMKNEGIIFSDLDAIDGDTLNEEIQLSTKEVLIKFIKEYKNWIDKDHNYVYYKINTLITLFRKQQKDLVVRDNYAGKAYLVWSKNNNESASVQIDNKFDEDKLNRYISVTIVKTTKDYTVKVEKLFSVNTEASVIFYVTTNTFILKEAMTIHNYEFVCINDCKIPSSRHLTDSEIIGFLMECSDYNSIIESVKNLNKRWIGVSLSDFIKTKGKLEVKQLISKETGNIESICIFTDDNGSSTYVGFSPYLGNESYTEIMSNIKDYYIQKLEDLECYILCTEESEGYKEVESNEWPYYWEEECVKELLIDLNIKHNINNYDITEPHKKSVN